MPAEINAKDSSIYAPRRSSSALSFPPSLAPSAFMLILCEIGDGSRRRRRRAVEDGCTCSRQAGRQRGQKLSASSANADTVAAARRRVRPGRSKATIKEVAFRCLSTPPALLASSNFF